MLMLLSFWITIISLIHPFHVSVCDMTYESSDRHLKISVRMFLDDLEEAFIKAIKNPPSGTIDYYDLTFPGLSLRASYGGGRSWMSKYRSPNSYDGRGEKKQRRFTIGKYPSTSLADGELQSVGATEAPKSLY